MQYPWAVPGAEVVCIVEEHMWIMAPPVLEAPPKFMQQYTIINVQTIKCGGLGCQGHLVLSLVGMSDVYEAGAFAPVQSIPIEEQQEAKSPLDRALELLDAYT